MSCHIVYPASGQLRGTILAFHGGNFSGGSVLYDRAQNEQLAARGYQVVQLDFPKTWDAFQEFNACSIVEDNKRDTIPVYCIGRSSGGFLAKVYQSTHNIIQHTLYLAPVFYPLERAQHLPKYEAGTRAFFGTDPNLSAWAWNPTRETVWQAKHDDHGLAFPDEIVQYFPGPQTHTGLVTNSSAYFIDAIDSLFSRTK